MVDITREILEIIANYKGVSVDEVTPQKSFEELGIDSLDAIDIVYEIEEKYGIDVPQESFDLSKAQTVGDVMQIVESVMAGDIPSNGATDAAETAGSPAAEEPAAD
jgi:acyl carrier protein